jgi:DNA (cytosine-5)-methyltransferase 1
MTPLRLGSLCTGIAGLELGLTLAGVETETVFVSDIDRGANRWLAANEAAPNLGDFTALDELPDVDLIVAGFPCQPVSTAGQRAGIHDERWLFDDITRLVGRMGTRPDLLLENVPGLLSANGGDAMGRVVYGLAGIGYGITWGTLSASAVGAPHRRNRWWGLASHADSMARNATRTRHDRTGLDSEPRPRIDTRPSHAPDADRASSEARLDTRHRSERLRIQPLGYPAPAPAADRERSQGRTLYAERRNEQLARARSLGARFGRYADAVARWETILGRPAPDPTDNGRLAPPFVEWMMGYPAGWVTDTLTNRREALHALGNAVVPQCAAAAFVALEARSRPL